MKSFSRVSLQKFSEAVAQKAPVPGGGAVAALTGGQAAALISMAAQYSIGRSSLKSRDLRLKKIYQQSERIRERFLKCVDADAEAYLQVVKTRQAGERERRAALRQARRVPAEVARLCYRAVELTPYLVQHGNENLLSDIEVAVELLYAVYQSALIYVAVNQ